jgi:hypothetical protein
MYAITDQPMRYYGCVVGLAGGRDSEKLDSYLIIVLTRGSASTNRRPRPAITISGDTSSEYPSQKRGCLLGVPRIRQSRKVFVLGEVGNSIRGRSVSLLRNASRAKMEI